MSTAYIYKWIQISTGKWYIGSKSSKNCHPDFHEKYICSSKIVKPLILANRLDWVYEILEQSDDVSYIRKLETRILIELDAKNSPLSYNNSNACFDPGNRLGRIETTETRQKKSLARQGNKNPSFGKKGKLSPLYGRKDSDETRQKKSEKLKNHIRSEDHNKNISKALKGNIKLSERIKGDRNPMFGKSATDYNKLMSKIKNSGNNNPMRQPQNQRTCPHCNLTIAKNHYTMYHGDKCKKLYLSEEA